MPLLHQDPATKPKIVTFDIILLLGVKVSKPKAMPYSMVKTALMHEPRMICLLQTKKLSARTVTATELRIAARM